MFWAGLFIFAAHYALLILDETKNHSRRPIGRRERMGLILDALMLAWLASFVFFVKYSEGMAFVYGALALLTLLLVTRQELHVRECDRRERWMHSLLFISYPLVVITLAAFWPFVSGLSWIVRSVLPFSTRGFRPLVGLYLVALVALIGFFVQRLPRVPPKDSLPTD
ncbi:MAG: hypothetical protein JST16_14850 [Bdellovibrionales bacterium]|nr:hypothetical protein [Bdellovibrionales bacterium]